MVLFGAIFAVFWWFFSSRWLGHLRARMAASGAKPRTPLRGTNQRLIEAKLRINLKAAEGAYRLLLDDQGFSLINAKGEKGGLAWGRLCVSRKRLTFTRWPALSRIARTRPITFPNAAM